MFDEIHKAVKIAIDYHKGQVDKAGKPYVLHPFAVANKLEGQNPKLVAYLHDTLEDTAYTEAQLRKDFGNVVGDAVVALTRMEGESYSQFILRVKTNPLATEVKIADIRHNMDLTRIPNPTEVDFRRVKKYEKALKRLEER